MRKFEQYQDMIARLFPELASDKTDEYGRKIISKVVTFQVTDACNLACTYCYQINKGERRMSFETAKKLVDMLLTDDPRLGGYVTSKNSPAIVIEFIGGEPFLNIDLIAQVVDYFYDKAIEMQHPWATKFRISICSNGVLYRDPKVQEFLTRYQKLVSFSVTIDGNKELHDSCRIFPDGKPSYDLALDAAQDWINRGYYMGSKITIAPNNLKYLYNAIIHFQSLGYEEINANTVFEKGWTIEHAREYYKQLKRVADFWVDNNLVETHYLSLFVEGDNFFCPKNESDNDNWCGGTGSMLAMDPDGYLYPCIRYMESSLGTDAPPLRIGHVDIGIGQTDCDKNCIDCLNAITRRSQSTDECFNCPIAGGCAWCFKEGTMVLTPHGQIPIEIIKPGFIILTADGNLQTVESTSQRISNDCYVIKIPGIDDIHTTGEHPFRISTMHTTSNDIYFEKPRWVNAKDINPEIDFVGVYVDTAEQYNEIIKYAINEKEKVIQEYEDHRIVWIKVSSIEKDEPGIVYNMSVANEHTFIANNVLVHNCSGYNYQEFGTPNKRATYICEMHKARSLANSYFWNKWYHKTGSNKRFIIYCPDEWALKIISEEELNMLKELSK